MGRETRTITVSIDVSRHNSAQDKADDLMFEAFVVLVERLAHDFRPLLRVSVDHS